MKEYESENQMQVVPSHFLKYEKIDATHNRCWKTSDPKDPQNLC